VYSLGALLYLILSGKNAHGDVSSASELARRVAEEDPVPPSEAAGDPALRGDLDTIVSRAMRRDPEDRYPSVERLQQDVEAYRASEPITARPSTLGYRARKFAARNRAVVMGAAVALLAVVGGGTAAAVGLVRARAAETEARDEARVAEEVTEFLVGLFEDPAPDVSQGEERTARELLDRGVERIGDQLQGQPAVQARLRYTMGRSYAALGDRQSAVSLYTSAAAGLSPDQEELLATIRVAHGASLRASGQPDDAIRILGLVVAATAPEVDTTDEGSLGRTETLSHALISAIQEIGISLAMKGAYDVAIDTLEFAHRLRIRLDGPSSDGIAKTIEALAYGYQMAGRTDEAIPHWAHSLELNAEHGERHPTYLSVLSNLASAHARVGRYEEARVAFERLIPLQEEVLGSRHPSLARTLSNYGTMFIDEGRPEEAVPYLRRALEIWEERFGPNNPAITASLNNLALVHQLAGEWAEAELLYQRAADIRRSDFGADSPRYASVLLGVGVARRNQENWAGAAEAYAEAIAILRPLGPVHPQALADYAQVLRALGRDSEAEEVEREAEASADPGSG
jgi:tetratricopeptide (TPR) repeat protein